MCQLLLGQDKAPNFLYGAPSGALHLAAYPLHYHAHDISLLRLRKPAPGRYAVPFGQASAAATARGVLRYEDGMAVHWRLPPVVRRCGGRKAAVHEILGMAADYGHTLIADILNVSRLQVKTAAEGRLRQSLKQVTEIVLHRFVHFFPTPEALVGKKVAHKTVPVTICFPHFTHIHDTCMQSKHISAKEESSSGKSGGNVRKT